MLDELDCGGRARHAELRERPPSNRASVAHTLARFSSSAAPGVMIT